MTAEPDDFNILAARTREAMAQMSEALIHEQEGKPPSEVMSAIAAGALCQAVQFFFASCAILSVPFAKGRAELDSQIDTYWKQALTRHLTQQAREKGERIGAEGVKRRKGKA